MANAGTRCAWSPDAQRLACVRKGEIILIDADDISQRKGLGSSGDGPVSAGTLGWLDPRVGKQTKSALPGLRGSAVLFEHLKLTPPRAAVPARRSQEWPHAGLHARALRR